MARVQAAPFPGARTQCSAAKALCLANLGQPAPTGRGIIAFAENAANQFGGVPRTNLPHDVCPMTLDGRALSPSRSAASLLVLPSAKYASTSRSRRVRGSRPGRCSANDADDADGRNFMG